MATQKIGVNTQKESLWKHGQIQDFRAWHMDAAQLSTVYKFLVDNQLNL